MSSCLQPFFSCLGTGEEVGLEGDQVILRRQTQEAVVVEAWAVVVVLSTTWPVMTMKSLPKPKPRRGRNQRRWLESQTRLPN